MLTDKEISRYNRHLILPEIGRTGQERLKNSRVLVIGAGGLGCPALLYLAAAGIGKIGVVDFDVADETNLQRQVLFDEGDIGHLKAETAAKKLQKQNSSIEIIPYVLRLSSDNALDIFSGYDIIVDGTDNFATRYLVNDACVLLGKTLVSGSIFKFQGQVAVFNHKNEKGKFGPTYRCLFPSPPSPESSPTCSEVGVMGVLPGIIGTIMANEAIKIIVKTGKLLSGRMLIADVLSMQFQTVEIERNPDAVKSMPKSADEFKKMNYDFFCREKVNAVSVKEISPQELFARMSAEKEESIQVIDVRELNEQPVIPELKGMNIPLSEIEKNAMGIPRNKMVVVICRSGRRSKSAVELLCEKHGFQNLYSLKGGVMEWMRKIDKQRVNVR